MKNYQLNDYQQFYANENKMLNKKTDVTKKKNALEQLRLKILNI